MRVVQTSQNVAGMFWGDYYYNPKPLMFLLSQETRISLGKSEKRLGEDRVADEKHGADSDSKCGESLRRRFCGRGKSFYDKTILCG